jgi:hypothetical protein
MTALFNHGRVFRLPVWGTKRTKNDFKVAMLIKPHILGHSTHDLVLKQSQASLNHNIFQD